MVAANKPRVEYVRVTATSDALRRVLVHPTGRKLRASGATEWPMDKFTARRIAEGSIKVEDGGKKAARSHAPTHSDHAS